MYKDAWGCMICRFFVANFVRLDKIIVPALSSSSSTTSSTLSMRVELSWVDTSTLVPIPISVVVSCRVSCVLHATLRNYTIVAVRLRCWCRRRKIPMVSSISVVHQSPEIQCSYVIPYSSRKMNPNVPVPRCVKHDSIGVGNWLFCHYSSYRP